MASAKQGLCLPMDDPRKTVGKNVARLRAARGLSQTGLADRLGPAKLGVTQGYISELEAGLKNPTLMTLAAIAEALSASLAELMNADAPIDELNTTNGTHFP